MTRAETQEAWEDAAEGFESWSGEDEDGEANQEGGPVVPDVWSSEFDLDFAMDSSLDGDLDGTKSSSTEVDDDDSSREDFDDSIAKARSSSPKKHKEQVARQSAQEWLSVKGRAKGRDAKNDTIRGWG